MLHYTNLITLHTCTWKSFDHRSCGSNFSNCTVFLQCWASTSTGHPAFGQSEEIDRSVHAKIIYIIISIYPKEHQGVHLS